MQRGAAHAIGATDDAHASPVTLVHLRSKAWQSGCRPHVGDEYRPRGISRWQPDIDDHDLAAPFTCKQMPAPRRPERHRELRADGSVRFAACEIEACGPVDSDDRRAVRNQLLRECKHLALYR